MTHLSRTDRFFQLAFLTLVACSISGSSLAGNAGIQTGRNQRGAEEEPVFHEYRGVQLGWLSADVRKKLGDPANKADDQDFYVFNEKETAQILYDKAQKVVTISVDFMNGAAGILTPQQVFGADIETKPDGSKYKMVRYPKAGLWLSYSRTAGDSPMVSVTLQKMAP